MWALRCVAKKGLEPGLERSLSCASLPDMARRPVSKSTKTAARSSRQSSGGTPGRKRLLSTEARNGTSTSSRARGKHFLSDKVGHFTESVIREMTRQAMLCGAVNLAQGFPDFPAPAEI